MIRQICPHCFQPVELPDAAAGTRVACPKCGVPFPVPGAYTPTVDPAAGPAPVPPAGPDYAFAHQKSGERPAPPPGLVPPTADTGPSLAAGADRSAGFALSPGVLTWVPPACVTLVLLLTFFTWVGTYAAGYPLYTQNAWQTLFGTISANPTIPDAAFPAPEGDMRAAVHSDWLMVPYLLLLLVTVVALWAERAVRDPDRPGLPPQVATRLRDAWPWRFVILAGLSALLLLLLGMQLLRGFGLERAVRDQVNAKFADAAAQAEASKSSTQQRLVEVQKGQELNRYGLSAATALELAFAAQVVALAALLALIWLTRRGERPAPRLLLQH